MTPARFQDLRKAFDQLSDVPADECTRLLEEMAHTDPQLSEELRKMLAVRENTTILDSSPVEQLRDLIVEGAQLGPYRIQREIGHGGMGQVYEAVRVDGGFQKRVAIKILRRELNAGTFLLRFNRERQILARLDHPHIAGIFDGGETSRGDPYFVMEYVDGVPITAYAETHSLGIDEKIRLFLEVCDAVQYAHHNLTVHRDLKPGNILVTKEGSVKLLDFGIAKLLEEEAGENRESPATESILTPSYTSPEQIRREPATTATDVFQLGILLYELLAGVHPFHSDKSLPHEVMRSICEVDPAYPSRVAKQDSKRLRGDLDTIIEAALRKEASQRYPSVEQLKADIERYRKGWPVLARGNSARYRLGKFVRRQWIPLTAAGLLLLTLGAGLFTTSYQAHRADVARAAADVSRAQAEQQRAAAEQQRLFAERAQRAEADQRKLAELRTSEAEAEKSKEQKRYREVRSLASSLLFDLYDGVRDLAGSATAKRLILEKAQHQLELLSAESGDEIALQRDLAACYERMGELRMDPATAKSGGAAAAVEAYQKGLDLRRRIAARPDAQLVDQRDLARSLAKFGDGQVLASALKPAAESYLAAHTLAQSLLKAHPEDASIQQTVGWIDGRQCSVLMATGDTSAAIQACHEGTAQLSPLAAASPDNVEVQKLAAITDFAYANALRLTNHPQEALDNTKLALTSLHRLENLAPNNAEYRRLESSGELVLANALATVGDLHSSLDAFRRAVHSMEVAIEIDPADLGSPLRLAYALRGFSRRLASAGKATDAHDADREALDLLRTTSSRPGAGPVEWNDYADALLKTDWPDLRGWPEALELAKQAVAKTNRKNPICLDTLAWAYYRNGNTPKAIDTEREALALLPANSKGGLRVELERGLKAFLAEKSP